MKRRNSNCETADINFKTKRSTKMKKENNTYSNNMIVTPHEYPRIFSGTLSQADFDPTKPNPRNISKIAAGLEQYLRYKQKGEKRND